MFPEPISIEQNEKFTIIIAIIKGPKSYMRILGKQSVDEIVETFTDGHLSRTQFRSVMS